MTKGKTSFRGSKNDPGHGTMEERCIYCEHVFGDHVNGECPKTEEIVAKNGEFKFTEPELKEAFEKVHSDNWKDPIDKEVVLKTERDRKAVHEAVIYYAGCAPEITRVRKGEYKYRVKAVGYYIAVGA